MTANGYDILLTGDGSMTLSCLEYGEAMHSVSGAYEEAVLKHVFPSGILNSGGLTHSVLDVGFGLGYNSLALAYEYFKRKEGRLEITALEKDRGYAEYLNSISFSDGRDEWSGIIKKAFETGRFISDRIDIEIIFGDARKYLLEYRGKKFNAVFHDPFSPAKNPELWTMDFFSRLFHTMEDDAVLTTYSSAIQARAAMIEAGFNLWKGPSVGGKREGTLASKGRSLHGYEMIDSLSITGDKRAVPYRDPFLSDDRGTIITGRSVEIAKRKGL
ncbi:MAG: MnmC family methyltransferase [Spirochaetes bacterium]|jgi:chorismate dehydratase|nr:MnmC family methyltransferase [Spirochaetota bacterium]